MQGDLVPGEIRDRLNDVNLRIKVTIVLLIVKEPTEVVREQARQRRLINENEHLQSRPHAASVSWKVFEVRNHDAAVDGILAFKRHALATTLRCHVNDRVVVDADIDLVANGPGETHGHSFIFGDVASASTSVSFVGVDEVECAEEVVRVELIV